MSYRFLAPFPPAVPGTFPARRRLDRLQVESHYRRPDDAARYPIEDAPSVSGKMQQPTTRRIEIFTVLVLVMGLAALAIPAIQRSREMALRSACGNSLKQIGMALGNYHDVYEAFPFGAVGNSELPPMRRWSWYPAIAPFLEAYPDPPINFLRDSSDPANWPVEYRVQSKEGGLETYYLDLPGGVICPIGEFDIGPRKQPLATYVGMAGLGNDAPDLAFDQERAGIWGYERQTALGQIEGGLAETILVIETASDRGVWLRSGPATLRGTAHGRKPHLGAGARFGGLHSELTLTLFADTSVRSLSDSMDRDVFQRMATIAADGVDVQLE